MSEVPTPVSITITGDSNDSKFVVSSTNSSIDDQPGALVKDSSHVVLNDSSFTTLQNDVNQIQTSLNEVATAFFAYLAQNGSSDTSGNGSGNGSGDSSGNGNSSGPSVEVSGVLENLFFAVDQPNNVYKLNEGTYNVVGKDIIISTTESEKQYTLKEIEDLVIEKLSKLVNIVSCVAVCTWDSVNLKGECVVVCNVLNIDGLEYKQANLNVFNLEPSSNKYQVIEGQYDIFNTTIHITKTMSEKLFTLNDVQQLLQRLLMQSGLFLTCTVLCTWDSVNLKGECVVVCYLINETSKLAIGGTAPEFEIPLYNPDGDRVKLSDMLYNDKFLLIDFWGSWCGPCREDNPKLLNYYLKYNKYIDFLGVTVGDTVTGQLDAIQSDKMLWNHVFQPSENIISQQYNIQYVPTGYLLNSDGIIIDKSVGGVSSKISKLAEENGWVVGNFYQKSFNNIVTVSGDVYKLVEGTYVLFEGYHASLEFVVDASDASNNYTLNQVTQKISSVVTAANTTIFDDCVCYCDSVTGECICFCNLPNVTAVVDEKVTTTKSFNNILSATTDASGEYLFNLIAGTYELTAETSIIVTDEMADVSYTALSEVETFLSSLFNGESKVSECVCVCVCDPTSLQCYCICSCKIVAAIVTDLLVSGSITNDYQLTITSKNVGNQILAGYGNELWNCIWLLSPVETETQIQDSDFISWYYTDLAAINTKIKFTHNNQDYWLVTPVASSLSNISWSNMDADIYYKHAQLAPGEETVINLDVSGLVNLANLYGSDATFAYIGDSPYFNSTANVWTPVGDIVEDNDTSQTTLSNNYFVFTVNKTV